MKKIIALALAVFLTLSLCACGKKAAESTAAAAQVTETPAASQGSAGKTENGTVAQPSGKEPAAPSKTETAAQSGTSEKVPVVPDVIDAAFLAGSWKASIDITDQLAAGMYLDEMKESWAELGVDDYSQFVSIRPAFLNVNIELNADSSFSRSVDTASVRAVAENFAQDVVDTHVRILEYAFNALCDENGITIDELYAETGVSDIYELIELVMEMTLDEYRDTIINASVPELEASLAEFTVSGTYSINGNALSFDHDGESDQGTYKPEDDCITLAMGVEMQFYRT